MSSNYGNASYGGYTNPKGPQRAPGTIGGGTGGTGNLDDVYRFYNAWLSGLVRDETGGWLYGKEIGYFSEEGLHAAWDTYMKLLKENGDLPSWWDPTYDWEHFLKWFKSHYEGNEGYGEDWSNKYFAFPIPDGVGVLLVLSLLCVLFTYLRSRDKKILEETEKTH
jgi:hypothetical protein